MPKAISGASVFPGIKTAPGLQVAGLLKANPSSNWKRADTLANEMQVYSPGTPTGLRAASLQRLRCLRENCPRAFPQSIVQGSRKNGRGVTDPQMILSWLFSDLLSVWTESFKVGGKNFKRRLRSQSHCVSSCVTLATTRKLSPIK